MAFTGKITGSALLAIGLVASFAVATWTLTYGSTSSQTLNQLTPPLQWGLGTDTTATSIFVPSLPTLNTNKTAVTVGILKGVPGATVSGTSFLTLTNTDSSNAHSVTITTTSDSGVSGLTTYQLVFSGGGASGTLNFLAGSPTVTLNVNAGGTTTAALTVTMADGYSVGTVTNTLTMGAIS